MTPALLDELAHVAWLDGLAACNAGDCEEATRLFQMSIDLDHAASAAREREKERAA